MSEAHAELTRATTDERLDEVPDAELALCEDLLVSPAYYGYGEDSDLEDDELVEPEEESTATPPGERGEEGGPGNTSPGEGELFPPLKTVDKSDIGDHYTDTNKRRDQPQVNLLLHYRDPPAHTAFSPVVLQGKQVPPKQTIPRPETRLRQRSKSKGGNRGPQLRTGHGRSHRRTPATSRMGSVPSWCRTALIARTPTTPM